MIIDVINIGLMMTATLCYGVMVWKRFRVDGSQWLTLGFFLMTLRRVSNYIVNYVDFELPEFVVYFDRHLGPAIIAFCMLIASVKIGTSLMTSSVIQKRVIKEWKEAIENAN